MSIMKLVLKIALLAHSLFWFTASYVHLSAQVASIIKITVLIAATVYTFLMALAKLHVHRNIDLILTLFVLFAIQHAARV